MTARVVDLRVRLALRRDVERLAAEHPEIAPERCEAWIAGEKFDSTEKDRPRAADEPSGEERKRSEAEAHTQRRGERPASRSDRDP